MVVLRQAVQVTGAVGLGHQGSAEPLQALLREQRVVQDSGQMYYPGERRQLRANPVQQLGNLGLLADVGCEGVNPALVALGDLLDHPLCLRVGSAPAGQHEVTGSALGQIRRRMQADRAESAGDQIASISPRLQRVRYLNHDLADVPCLLHAAERGPGLGDRINFGRQRHPLALGQSLGQLGQQAPNTLRFSHGHRVQGHDLVLNIGAGLGHLLGRPDVAFGDLSEAAVLGGRPHGRVQEPLIGQAVEHYVNARAVGIGQDLVSEIGSA